METLVRKQRQTVRPPHSEETSVRDPLDVQNRKLRELIARKNRVLESMIKEVRRVSEVIDNHLTECPIKHKYMVPDQRGVRVNLLSYDYHILHKAQEVYNESSIYLQ